MSETALLLAVRDQLREACGYTQSECDIEMDAECAPTSGDKLILVLPGEWRPYGESDEGGCVLDESHGVNVMVATRIIAPQDRKRNMLIDNLSGINSECRKVIAALHFSYRTIMNRANELIVDSGYGFHHPLKFGGVGRPQVLGSDFFKASAKGDCGMARTVSLIGARRTQPIGDMA